MGLFQASGQKKLIPIGIVTSPSPSNSNVRSISGCVSLICSLKDLESLANKKLSTNSLIFLLSFSPFTEVIKYFNLVDNSGEAFLFTFLSPLNSASIFASS